MATTGVMNGSLLNVKFIDTFLGTPTEKIDLQTECSLSMSMDTRDITTKASGGYRQLLGGLRSGSLTFTALFAEDATNGFAELFASFTNASAGGRCHVLFTTDATGDVEYDADAILTSLDVSSGTEDNVTMTGTFELSGAITTTTIA
jgi:hypothetical protein